MVKKILIGILFLSMIFVNGNRVYADDNIYILTHNGIIQEGNFEQVEYHLDKNLEDYLLDNLEKKSNSINLSNYHITVDQIDAVVQELLNNNPRLYNVSFDTCSISNNLVIELYPKYQVAKTKNIDDSYETVVQSILSNITDEMTDLEKIVYIHEWLVLNVEYDYENYQNGTIPRESYTAYGALVNGVAVCQGYAEAYKDLLDRLGFENILVSSNYLNHVWNQVCLNGDWYYIDATWDDPVPDKKGQVRHTNLLVSQEELISTGHDYGDWTFHYSTESTKYDDYFWEDVTQPLELIDGYVFSASNSYNESAKTGEVTISKVDINTQDSTKLIQFTDRWYVLDKSGYFWMNAFSGCVYHNGRIYYNNSTQIRSIASDGSDDQLVLDVDPTTNYLTGLMKFDDGLYYILQDISNTTGNPSEMIKFMDAEVPVTSIEIKPKILNISIGQTQSLEINILPSYHTDTNISYISSNPEVVVIDNQGNVTGVSKGNATVTIVASNGVSANCEITVLEDNLLLGDVNNDNLINYSDAVILLQADSKLIELTELQKSVADVNKDKIVDYNDAVQILRYDAGIITGFE